MMTTCTSHEPELQVLFTVFVIRALRSINGIENAYKTFLDYILCNSGLRDVTDRRIFRPIVSETCSQ